MKNIKLYLKAIVIFVNQGLFLLGIIMLIISIILKDIIINMEDSLEEQIYDLQNIPILLPRFSFKSLLGVVISSIINGIVIVLVCLLGCYGAYYENIHLLKSHMISMSVAALFDFSMTIVLFIETRKMQLEIDDDICKLIICPHNTEYIVQILSVPACISLLIIGITEIVIIFNTCQLYLHIKKPPLIDMICNRALRRNSNSSSEPLSSARCPQQIRRPDHCNVQFISNSRPLPSAPPASEVFFTVYNNE